MVRWAGSILVFIFALGSLNRSSWAQQAGSTVELKELAAPNSPAFMILDISPALIESPATPKEFTFAAIQSFVDGQGWPQNFAVEFTPYWWIRPSGRDVYAFAGIDKNSPGKPNPFSGLKFSNFSIAFVNKDLVPDVIEKEQKILSVGFHSNVLRIQRPGYALALNNEINRWHQKAQEELAIMQELMNQETDRVKQKKLQQELNNKTWPVSADIASKINALVNQKPVFSWNLAAAYSLYGLDDRRFETGRTGVWTTLASYLPLKKTAEDVSLSYLKLLVYSRYMHDGFMLEGSDIVKSSSMDLGSKIGLEFNKFSIGFEFVERNYLKNALSSSRRSVGLISYRVDNSLYINGTFGRDFGPVKKIVSLFGINWGFGDEKVNLPAPE